MGTLGWGNEKFVYTVFFSTRVCYTALQVVQGHIFGDVKIASQVDNNNVVVFPPMTDDSSYIIFIYSVYVQ